MAKAKSKVSKGKKAGGKPSKPAAGRKGSAAKKSTRKASAMAKAAAPKPGPGKGARKRSAASKTAKAAKAAGKKPARAAATPRAVKRTAPAGRNRKIPTTVGPGPFAPPAAVEGNEPSAGGDNAATGNAPIERGGAGPDAGPM